MSDKSPKDPQVYKRNYNTRTVQYYLNTRWGDYRGIKVLMA